MNKDWLKYFKRKDEEPDEIDMLVGKIPNPNKKTLEDKLLDGNRHLNKMIFKLDDIRGDANLHLLPDILHVIGHFKQGFNGTYQKIIEYEKMRKDMDHKCKAAEVPYIWYERRVYLWEYIKEPYSPRFPETFWIRFFAHLCAHANLRYWLRDGYKENFQLTHAYKDKLKDKYIEPIGSSKKEQQGVSNESPPTT